VPESVPESVFSVLVSAEVVCSASSEPSVTVKSFFSSPRMTVTVTVSPVSCDLTARIMPSAEVISSPSMAMMMSPASMPADSAGLPERTSAT